MAAACKPWREALADDLSDRSPVPSIWFLLPRYSAEENRDDCCEFPSFSEAMGRRYIFSIPAPEKTIVIGSSNGWLMLAGELSRVQAFNPLTKAKVFFPPSSYYRFGCFRSVQKAVFVPPKPGLGRINSPLLVVILQTGAHSLECSELAFAAAGDDFWTDLLNISSPVLARTNFQDIVADDGKLYALDERSHVLVFDLGGEKPSSSSSRATVMVIKVKAHSDPRCMKSLAVISGEPILVQRWTCKDRPLGLTRRLPTFEVFRLRAGPQKRFRWVKTRDLAGHAILHSSDGVLALPVGKYGELTADCIYSVEADEINDKWAWLTVMNIDSRPIHFELISTPASCFPSWFLPNSGS